MINDLNDQQYLDPLCDFALQLFCHKVLEHKTPTKRLSFSFVLLSSHKVSVVDDQWISLLYYLQLIIKHPDITL